MSRSKFVKHIQMTSGYFMWFMTTRVISVFLKREYFYLASYAGDTNKQISNHTHTHTNKHSHTHKHKQPKLGHRFRSQYLHEERERERVLTWGLDIPHLSDCSSGFQKVASCLLRWTLIQKTNFVILIDTKCCFVSNVIKINEYKRINMLCLRYS